MTPDSAPTFLRGFVLRGFALGTLALCLGLGSAGERAPEFLRRTSERLTGEKIPKICPFRAQTGFPCLGCFGTRSFVDATRGRFGRALRRNALGAFLGASVWLLGLASVLSLATGWRRPFLGAWLLVLSLSPVAFLYRTITWWSALPAGAFQLH